MHRVLIIGNCGAGKSTFARKLARKVRLPLIHLDQCYWQPGWIEPDPDDWLETLRELVAEPRWIMDGNYSSTFSLRFPRADTVIWIQASRWACLFRVLRRSLRYRGRRRPDMAPGCPERFSLSFLHYVFWTFASRRQRITRHLETFSGQVVLLRTRRQQDRFLQALPEPLP